MRNFSNQKGGFIRLIILIVVVLLLMRHFNLTITGILSYFHLTWSDLMNFLQQAFNWLKDLFNSVR